MDVTNAAVQGVNDSSIVYYSLSCDSGYSFADGVDSSSVYGYCNDASVSYTFHADSDSAGCFAKCPTNPNASLISDAIDNLESLVLVESANGAVQSAEVVCSNGFDVAYGAAKSYDFTCKGALADNADEGTVTCTDACPVCIATCPAAIEDDDELDFIYIDGTAPNGNYTPGHNHIEAICKNSSLSLIGERYASCSNGSLNFEVEAPICVRWGDICEHPVVTNAVLTNTDNIMAREKYTIVCNEGYSLLNIDAEIYGRYGSKTVAEVPCRGMELEDVVCYQSDDDDDDYETYSTGFRASAGLMTLVTLLVILAE